MEAVAVIDRESRSEGLAMTNKILDNGEYVMERVDVLESKFDRFS